MVESEANNIESLYDNLGETFSSSPDNIQTSDELSLHEDFFHKQDTDYAFTKREDAKAKRLAAILGIGATAIAGGALLGSSFLPSLPTISNANQFLEGSVLHYHFELTQNDIYEVRYYVYLNETEVATIPFDVKSNTVFEGTIDIEAYSKEAYVVTALKGSLFDYTRTIEEYIVQKGVKQ